MTKTAILYIHSEDLKRIKKDLEQPGLVNMTVYEVRLSTHPGALFVPLYDEHFTVRSRNNPPGKEIEVIVIYETILDAILKDVAIIITLAFMFGIAWLFNSTMLALLAMAATLGLIYKVINGNRRLSIPEARTRLDELERMFRS